jgi:hypothetical protein
VAVEFKRPPQPRGASRLAVESSSEAISEAIKEERRFGALPSGVGACPAGNAPFIDEAYHPTSLPP